MERTKDNYGVQMTSMEIMEFAKHLDNSNISMNTLTPKERTELTSKWLCDKK